MKAASPILVLGVLFLCACGDSPEGRHPYTAGANALSDKIYEVDRNADLSGKTIAKIKEIFENGTEPDKILIATTLYDRWDSAEGSLDGLAPVFEEQLNDPFWDDRYLSWFCLLYLVSLENYQEVKNLEVYRDFPERAKRKIDEIYELWEVHGRGARTVVRIKLD